MASHKFTVVVTDHVEPDLRWEEQVFQDAGVQYHHHRLRFASPDEVIEAASHADVLIVDQAQITPEVIGGLERCKLIIRHGDGYDNLDLHTATEAGIICINEPGFWNQEVAEQAFTIGLSIALRIPLQQEVARSPKEGLSSGWDLHRVMPYTNLGSLTVGIIGFGRIGSKAAGLYRNVVGNLLVHDPYLTGQMMEDAGAVPVELNDLIKRADLISLHLPATMETHGLINGDRIAAMKRGALLVNAARGSLVDTDALVSALESGHLAGAALDSTNPEPLPADHPLMFMDNVIVTPHMSWYSQDALDAIRRQIVSDALGVVQGRIPKTIVNPEVLQAPNLRLR